MLPAGGFFGSIILNRVGGGGRAWGRILGKVWPKRGQNRTSVGTYPPEEIKGTGILTLIIVQKVGPSGRDTEKFFYFFDQKLHFQ